LTSATPAVQEGPAISVIIPCRGHAHLLRGCLEALGRQEISAPYEVIVVDSASDPEVADAVGDYPAVRLIRSEAGLGPGSARNLGSTHASGWLLAFTDADCEPAPGWLQAALGASESEGRMVGGPVLDARPRHPVSVADNLLQFAEFRSGRSNGRATHFPSCNLAIRRTDFETLGRFPEEGLGEDIVLCRRMHERRPEALVFVPKMAVRHLGRTGFPEMLRHHHTLGYWRGRLHLRIGRLQERLGAFRLMIPPFALWRFIYICRRTVSWDPRGLPRLVLLSPMLLAGLVAWAMGFRQGIIAAKPSA
jgi:glycosyltransferase involved in cell wall biosynthesis